MPKKSKRRAWRDVEAGQYVELKGRVWYVEELAVKKKGKVVRVTISSGSDTVGPRDLDGSLEVTITKPEHDGLGTPQASWASPKKLAKAMRKGEADPKYRAAEVVAEKVDKPTKGESTIFAEMHGQPIATTDVNGAYVVPAVDPSTIDAHLLLFHYRDEKEITWPTSYAEKIELHDRLHAERDFATFHRHKGQKP